MTELLEEFKVFHERKVQFSDLGITEHVNNVTYFRFFDDARSTYLDAIEFSEFYGRTGINYIVVSNHCDYKAELRYKDELRIGIRAVEISKHKAKLEFRLYCVNQEKVAARAYTVILCFDYKEGKHVPFPQELRQRIERLEGKSFG